MKRWIAAFALGLFSFAALADDAPAPSPEKAEKPTKGTKKMKKKADAKKDDAQKAPETK